MSKKFGLGKGLNALIPEDTILNTLDTKATSLKARQSLPETYNILQ